ncbi:type IV secretion system DNA-binding domain-containing protein [Paraferrimonas sedimenticola]|uniref:DNA phosphorothioation-dependent restriction protein DptH n=1 Tax=Paraferrimonas sedimenticola TaxID=375674 RepID=A0AA37VYE6_9GAMM|nr:type IV secretion system DNA-binding domain-containing protein [Paraferrimonas sedimenticola]GLP97001.1 hypothetical protein GCM10007895_23070 [Paraferrimonas sedimenticola]
MNLFVKSLDEYLKMEWASTLEQNRESKEARFIIQSMGPNEVFQLFASLEAAMLEQQKHQSVKYYFKVASGLWNDWCESESAQTLDNKMGSFGGLGPSGKRNWIDEEDKLTWYRNRTLADEKTDCLIVVLVGLNHATDQGGLSDFHQVDERRLWLDMERKFTPWLSDLFTQLDINASEQQISNFNEVLVQLFELRPLQLAKLAQFIETSLTKGNEFYSFNDVAETFFRELPYWGLPPFLIDSDPTILVGKNGRRALKNAEIFISHSRYKSDAGKKKDWAKIENWFLSDNFELPQSLEHAKGEFTVSDYRDALHRFIFNADSDAKVTLLSVDFVPLLNTLGAKETKSRTARKTIKSYSGLAFESILQGTYDALISFKKGCGSLMAEQLSKVQIEIISFEHDFVADEETGANAHELAHVSLIGCLGGLDTIVESLDCRVPVDDEEASAERQDWNNTLPISLIFEPEEIGYKASRSRPRVKFRVTVASHEPELTISQEYFWQVPPTQPERVFVEYARRVLNLWHSQKNTYRLLPAFKIPSVLMTALYYAADEEEANRLISQALTDIQVYNLLVDLPTNNISEELNASITRFISNYIEWLSKATSKGYYSAADREVGALLSSYVSLAELALSKEELGGPELLRRLYKAFFIIDQSCNAADSYVNAAIAWGLSPSVLEQLKAKHRFLADGFPEVIAEISLDGEHQRLFERLLDLSKVRRPISALVNEENQLSADMKSYGLLHYLGPEPKSEMSLAVQTMLRETEDDDEVAVAESIRPCQETKIVSRVIEDYLKLHPHANDGIRILAVNVKDLQTILSGINYFLSNYLKEYSAASKLPPFHLSVMVYTSAASPMAMENRLSVWREQLLENFGDLDRGLQVTLGHQYTTQQRLAEQLKLEENEYDLAFLFHFLKEGLVGRADPAKPFEFQFDNCSFFPIAEYPRPTSIGDKSVRQNLISNRRLRVQTRHSDMSARLCFSGHEGSDYVVFGKVDIKPWKKTLDALHDKGYWVACIDPYVDKALLADKDGNQRKMVGFASGLGGYGELNLTISTQKDTLKQLANAVSQKLKGLIRVDSSDDLEFVSVRVVDEAEQIVGLSSIRAVVGEDERIREVIGFSAIRKALRIPKGQMTQLIPLDDMMHWFSDAESNNRPDLLQLTLELRENEMPLIHAHLIECKLALENPEHLSKAITQIEAGMSHLTKLLAPHRRDLNSTDFDRRYWWAQLHRALSSRSEVNLPDREWRELDYAFENIAEGKFEIHWRSTIFTFWTNREGNSVDVSQILLSPDVVRHPFTVDDNFTIQHVAMGYTPLKALLSDQNVSLSISGNDGKIGLRPEQQRLPTFCEGETTTIQTHTNDSDIASTSHKDDLSNQVGGIVESEGDEEESIVSGELSQSTPEPGANNISEQSENIQCRSNEQGAPHAQATTPTESAISHGTEATVQDLNKDTSVPEVSVSRASESDEQTHLKETSHTEDVKEAPSQQLEFNVPNKILIGQRRNGDSVYWYFGHPKLANRHLLIFGSSGSGKTYGIQCLLAELAIAQVRSFIVDYTNGFLPNQVESEFKMVSNPKDHFVRTDKLPLNPFRKQQQFVDPSLPPIEETSFDVASRITSIFTSVFPNIGDQQSAALIRTLQEGLDSDAGFNFEKLLAPLREASKQGESLANKLQPFVDTKPFSDQSDQAWEQMLATPNHWVHVLQLATLNRDIQKIITEFALWDLWDFAQNTGNKDRPIPIVLDEIQNLDHSSDSPIDKMLREGRKFGLSLILATQTTSQFNQEQRDRLFQAGHKLFFKPASTEVDRFAQILSQSTPGTSKSEWMQRLNKLEKGQCWSLGPVEKSNGTMVEEPVLVSITSLEQRNF